MMSAILSTVCAEIRFREAAVSVGAWRSPVAHSLGVREVGRSNRLAPTS